MTEPKVVHEWKRPDGNVFHLLKGPMGHSCIELENGQWWEASNEDMAAEIVRLAAWVEELETEVEIAQAAAAKALNERDRLREALGWALAFGEFSVAIDNPLHARSLDKARAALWETSDV